MTSRTPRRHRRLALMAAGTAVAMVLLPGAASAQVDHSSAQQVAGTSSLAAAPSDPVVPSSPHGPALPSAPSDGGPAGVDGLVAQIEKVVGKPATPGLTGSDGDRGHYGDVVHRDDSPDSDHLDDPHPPDHASGAVADVDLLKSDLLEITEYDASIEDNDEAHADSTVLGLGGSRIVGSSADSRDHNREGENGDALKTCNATGGLICLSLLYHNTVATEEHDSALAAARGGVLALCLLGDNDEVIASYECDGISLGVAEGLGIAERDKKHGHTKADSANELLNLCIGKREKLTTPCDGIGLQAVHVDTRSKSEKPETERHSFLLGIDLNGSSTYLLDGPTALALPDDCGDSAILCLFLNQGKSVIFKNPKGAGSVQEMLRLDVLNKTLLVVLGQAETLAHETEGRDHHKKDEPEKDHGDKGDHGKGDEGGDGGGELAETGADVAQLLAGGFLLTGLGALTLAASRRRAGKHTL